MRSLGKRSLLLALFGLVLAFAVPACASPTAPRFPDPDPVDTEEPPPEEG